MRAEAEREQNLKSALSQVLKHSVTAIATAKDYIYAGDSEGRLRVSADAGVSWGAASKLGESGASGGDLGGPERSPRGGRGVGRANQRRRRTQPSRPTCFGP